MALILGHERGRIVPRGTFWVEGAIVPRGTNGRPAKGISGRGSQIVPRGTILVEMALILGRERGRIVPRGTFWVEGAIVPRGTICEARQRSDSLKRGQIVPRGTIRMGNALVCGLGRGLFCSTWNILGGRGDCSTWNNREYRQRSNSLRRGQIVPRGTILMEFW